MADVIETHDLDAFLRAVEAVPAGAVIVDRSLIGASGFVAIRAVRAAPEHREVVIVATTGSSVDRGRLEAIDACADEYLPKVSELHTMPSVIERICCRFGPERAARRAAVRERYFTTPSG
jgi:DNA-binding response OmpR family regulator